MAKQVVSVGTNPDDGTGDTLRVGGGKINSNFDELYLALGDGANLTVSTVIDTAYKSGLTGNIVTPTLNDYAGGITNANVTASYQWQNVMDLFEANFVVRDSIPMTDPKIRHTLNYQTGTSYTLVLSDQNKVVTMNNASANTLTIPAEVSVAFPTGTVIIVYAIGSGTTTIAASGSTRLHGLGTAGDGYAVDIQTRYSAASILKIGSDSWIATGDINQAYAP